MPWEQLEGREERETSCGHASLPLSTHLQGWQNVGGGGALEQQGDMDNPWLASDQNWPFSQYIFKTESFLFSSSSSTHPIQRKLIRVVFLLEGHRMNMVGAKRINKRQTVRKQCSEEHSARRLEIGFKMDHMKQKSTQQQFMAWIQMFLWCRQKAL